MKKAIWFLIISFLFVGSVSARQLADEDIKANSIVIGTHLFEAGVSNPDVGYTGTINTKFAMLGAASISSDTIDDMTIYYKFMNGFWVDYITKTKVTIPESFKICYVNGVYTNDDDCERGSGDIPGDEHIVNVTFKASDFNETKKVPVKKDTVISPDNAPELSRKLGFEFAFWSKEGETTAFDFTKPITEDITLEVNWKPIQYKIYYHSNFGEDVKKEVTCSYESAENKCTLKGYLDVLASNDFVGNEFEGWSLTPIKAGLIPAEKTMDDIIGDEAEFHLYAIWKLNSYTLTYNGTGTAQNLTCVYNNFCSLADFTPAAKKGYVFDHWYFEVTNGDEVTKTVVPTEFKNLTSEKDKTFELKAAYKTYDYKINYNLDGGRLDVANPGLINIENTDGIVLENSPTKEGYTFNGWVLGNAEEDNYVELTKSPTTLKYSINLKNDALVADDNGINVKATWVENEVTISLFDERGNPIVDDENVGRTVSCHYEDRTNCKIGFNPPASDGRTFLGWEVDGIINKPENAFSSVAYYTEASKNITVTAVWHNKESYNIEYELNGGKFVEDATPVLSFAAGTPEVTLPANNTVTKTGYEFVGWIKYVEPEREQPAEQAEPSTITKLTSPVDNVKVIALWNPITYTIKLNKGSEVIDTITCTYDTDCSLKDHHATFNGTSFIGWGTDANTLVYGDNSVVKNLTSTKGETVNLYAVNGNYYNVSFYLDGGALATPINLTDVISVGNKNKDMTVNLSGVTPTKEGYTFDGWIYGDSTVDDTGVVNITKDTLFIAKWRKNTYTVKLYFGPENSSNKDITVEHGDTVLDSDISGLDITGKWMIGNTEITDLAAELGNPVTGNKEYKRVYTVQLLDKDRNKTVEVVAGNKAIDKFDSTDNLDGKWYIDEATEPISDLRDYLTNTSIGKNYVITKAKAVVFRANISGNPGNVLELDVKYNSKVDVTKLTAAVTEHGWYLGDTLITSSKLAAHFGDKTITEDLIYDRAYTITFDDTTSKTYSAKYNEKFDKTKIDAAIMGEQWYLGNTFADLTTYFDSDDHKIVGDLVFSKVYSVYFLDNGATVSPSPIVVKYNSNLDYDGLPDTIKNSTWMVGEENIVLADYLREHPISSNVTFFKTYSVKLIYNGGPKQKYVKAGERADNKFKDVDLSGSWLNGENEITDLADYLVDPVTNNLTFTKLYTVTLEYNGKTDKDVVKVPYNTNNVDLINKFKGNGINFGTAPYNGVWIFSDRDGNTSDLDSDTVGWYVTNDLTLYRAYTVKLESKDNVVSVAVREGNKAISQLQENITRGDIWFNGGTEVEIGDYLDRTSVNSDITLKKAYTVTLAHSGTQQVFKVPYKEKAKSKITGITFTDAPYNGKWKNGSTPIDAGGLENYLTNLTVSDNITISTIATLTLQYNGGPKEVTVVGGRVKTADLNGVPLAGTWFKEGSDVPFEGSITSSDINSDLVLVKGYSVTLNYVGNSSKDTVIVPYNTTGKAFDKFEANGIDFTAETYNGEWINDNNSEPIVPYGLGQHLKQLTVTEDTTISKKTTS